MRRPAPRCRRSENGASVLQLEISPEHWRGGNSAFTGGAWRIVYHGFDDLARLIPDISDHELSNVDVGTYTEEQYYDDMGRLTEYRCDPDLTEILITQQLRDRRLDAREGRALPARARPPGLPGRRQVQVLGRARLPYLGRRQGIDQGARRPRRRARASRCFTRPRRWRCCRATAASRACGCGTRAGFVDLRAKAVVLACGGFEANAEMRARYLGPGWDLAKVRGSRFNTGQGLRMALDIGAAPAGHWSGAHACAWDLNAPPVGDLDVGDRFQKHGYPFGIVVNARGQRFLDEGADFHSYTYAKYGGEILKQPGMFAWQIFDQKTVHLLRDEYRIPRTTKEKADTFEALAERLEGRRPAGLSRHRARLQRGAATDVPFNPNIHDGLRTTGLAIDKTNWAQRLDTPPYEAYGVTTGITFTFGGLKITNDAAGRGRDRRADPRPLRRRRDRRRALLPQLRQRHRADGRRRVRPHRRPQRGAIRRAAKFAAHSAGWAAIAARRRRFAAARRSPISATAAVTSITITLAPNTHCGAP